MARTFAREGAKVFLSSRTLGKVERVAKEIVAAGGAAQAFEVDALDEQAVESHVVSVFKQTGRAGLSFNAITAVPQPGTQGIPIAQLSVDAFIAPITLSEDAPRVSADEHVRKGSEQCTEKGINYPFQRIFQNNRSAEKTVSAIRSI